MTPDEAIERLQWCYEISRSDREAAHVKADETLCAFLTALGYDDVVEAFNDIDKRYS